MVTEAGAPLGVIGVGATLFYGDTGTTTPGSIDTTVAEVTSIFASIASAQPVETTLLADTVKSYVSGQFEYGEMTVGLRYTETNASAVSALYKVQKAWKILLP